MTSKDWFQETLILVTYGVLVWNCRQLFRMRRLCRKLASEREQTLAELLHTTQLNALLTHICVQAVYRDYIPAWKAWARTMGRISVSVRAHPHQPDDTAG